MRLSLVSDKPPQPRDTRDPARNPSRPFHGGWSAMPLMAYVPSRPECSGPAKVIATAVEALARAAVPSRRQLRRTVITAAHLSFLRKQEWLCSALDPCFRRDDGCARAERRSALGIAEAVGRPDIG